jgi:hypothetical protein
MMIQHLIEIGTAKNEFCDRTTKVLKSSTFSSLMSTIRLSDLKSGQFDMDCEHFNFLPLEWAFPGENLLFVKSGIILIFYPEIPGVIITGIDNLELKVGPKHGNRGTEVFTTAPSRTGGIAAAIAESKCGRCGILFNYSPFERIRGAVISQSAST